MKRTRDAVLHAKKARDLITSQLRYELNKDFLDLLILEAELDLDRFKVDDARGKLQEAIAICDPGDAEKSEIAARCHMMLGEVFLKGRSDNEAADQEFQCAFGIWDRLGESFAKANATWRKMELEKTVDRKTRSRLLPLPPLVGIEAVRLAGLERRPGSSSTLSQRAEFSDSVWNDIVAKAMKNVAIQRETW